MLIHTFCHIQGIGPKSESLIWKAGITDWHSARDPETCTIIKKLETLLRRDLQASLNALDKKDPWFFCSRLPSRLHWRLFPDFRDEMAYIDIETNGLDAHEGMITTIALYDGRTVKWYINGRNLDNFVEDIQRYKILVSYNGKSFDIPYIETFFRIKLNHCHIDLRHIMASLGFKGGLKSCETQLGLDRGLLKGIDGFFAPLLWQDFTNNDNERALETLLAYNIEDAVNLEILLVEAYNRKIANTPFSSTQCIEMPKRPILPFFPDLLTLENIKRQIHAWKTHAAIYTTL